MVRLMVSCLLFSGVILAAAKPHVVSFGKWTPVKVFSGSDGSKINDMKVRPLYVDARMKEFTFGSAHEITEHLFVVRRIVRVNDSLPQEAAAIPRWAWQPAGWLEVDRVSGRVSGVSLPGFDPESSSASWYRDYVAYCGISDDEKKTIAVVMQLGQRKPVLKKSLGEASGDAGAADCAEPVWQRQPARVMFVARPDQKLTFSVRSRAVEAASEEDEGTE